MAIRFTQEEVERELSGRLPHGSRREVSRISGIGESHIKRQFNPYDESASCVFRTLQIVCALDEIDEKVGDIFWAKVCEFRDLSKPRKTKAKGVNDLGREAGELGREVSELLAARLTDRPLAEQMKEFTDVCRQVEAVKTAMITEISKGKKKKEETVVCRY